MQLLEYIKALDSNEEREDFATRCETTLAQLKQGAYFNRRAGESLAINIDRESGGVVSCEELRPDVDWAYIRNSSIEDSQGAA